MRNPEESYDEMINEFPEETGESLWESLAPVQDPDALTEQSLPASRWKCRIEAPVSAEVGYASYRNGQPVVQSVTVENMGKTVLEQAELYVESRCGLLMPYTRCIDLLPAGRSVLLKDVAPEINAAELLGLTETVTDTLTFSLRKGEEIITECRQEVCFLPFDQWQGSSGVELLSAFVTPNHPAVAGLMGKVSELLESWTGDPSLDAYQGGSERALKIAAAAYEVLRAQQIVYCVSPPHFEANGQRVRLCDEILRDKMGNCLELTLLYNAMLERLGLHGLAVIVENHAFAGVWLEDTAFSCAVLDDGSQLSKRMADGLNELTLVECTAAVKGRDCTFDYAVQLASQALNEKKFYYVLDIARARAWGFRPLPQRIALADGSFAAEEYEAASSEAAAPEKQVVRAAEESYARPLTEAELRELERRRYWERKLLDLGLRNTLINLRRSANLIPILTDSLHELENQLSGESGKAGERQEFTLLPKPEEWKGEVSFDTLHLRSDCTDLVRKEFEKKRLRTTFTENELKRSVKQLYRTARTALEESGANTLYLAMGLLKWFEAGSSRPHYAPLILIPVELVRKAAGSDYTVRRRDEDAQMNITVLEKLKQDFRLEIEGVDPLPEDARGIDTLKVFTLIRSAIMDRKGWDVLESAYLGLFSFSQFVMWNDLRNRSEELRKNKVVASLMQGKLQWNAESMTLPEQVEEDPPVPLPVDASQLYAIREAVAGKSFVLHGPPGTGKSHTITSIIASALAQGKTVLFVAEKMVALEVVQQRLEKLGIGPFCLELHSNKARKRTVIDQLQRATEIIKYASQEEYGEKAERLAALRKELSSYSETLHRRQSCGKTLFELINEAEALEYAPDLGELPEQLLSEITPGKANDHILLLERMITAGRELGHPAEHPLRALRCSEYTQAMRTEVPRVTENYRVALERARTAFLNYAEISGRAVNSARQLELEANNCETLLRWKDLPRTWAKSANLNVTLIGAKELAQHFVNAETISGALQKQFSEDVLQLDGAALLAEYKQAGIKHFPMNKLGERAVYNKLRPYMNGAVPKETLGSVLQALANYRKERSEGEELLRANPSVLGERYAGLTTDWQRVLREAKQAEALSDTLEDGLRQKLGGLHSAETVLAEVRTAMTELKKAAAEFRLLLKPETLPGDNYFERQLDFCDTVLAGRGELRKIAIWNRAAEDAEQAGLSAAVNAYRMGMEHEDVIPAYRKALARQLAVRVIDGVPELNSFSGTSFRAKVEQLRRMDEEMLRLTQQEIYCRLAANAPDFTKEGAATSELGVLQKAIRSGCRGMSLRKLFDSLPNMLPRLCPCMLMSPLSAAQYLNPGRKPFDLVIFDEASQLPTCKAVGVLARGENAVIVGDPKQMPPTAFFMANSADEENLDKEDLESILDDCLSLNMPETHLLWHYRSRHESLIAFSNREFYDNRLYTFPSVNDRERKVRLVPVQGCFDRGGTRRNPEEARAVIDELKRRAHSETEAGLSVGVVTFNVTQQNLIEDLLNDACREDPELERWVYRADEPLFIKNLENVQGDERDVILFSVGYGPDKEGRVSVNFGPLNRDGGWRRLNVAVSRSRCEMIVFSALMPEQINVAKTSARGVEALRDFLAFAAGKPLAETEAEASRAQRQECDIALSVCDALANLGYQADCLVGRSEYRIDVGVIDPEDPERYCLGILLDGEAYGKAQTVRDREIGRTNVLENLGWKLLRIYAMDWWEDRDAVLREITEALKQPEVPEPEKAAVTEALPERTLEGLIRPQEYAAAELGVKETQPEVFLRTSAGIRARVDTVIGKEAPICESLLIDRILQSFGGLKNVGRVHDHLCGQLQVMKLRTSVFGEEKIYWRKDQIPAEYTAFRKNGENGFKREIREIPVQEAANAMLYVLLDQVSLYAEPLTRETARTLGFQRTTDPVKEYLGKVQEYLCGRGMMKRDEAQLCVLTEAGMERARLVMETMR